MRRTYAGLSILAFAVLSVLVLPSPADAVRKPDDYVPAPVVAVLYFENATGFEHLAWLPKGFADLMIRDLHNTGQVNVIPRRKLEEVSTTYRQAQGSPFSNVLLAARMGKILGATHVLAGRFVRNDTDLVIEVKLVDVVKNRTVGWRSVQGSADEPMYLQKEANIKALDLLKIRLDERGLINLLQIPTTNIKAFAYYSMGLDALDAGDRELGRSYFQSALDADRFFRPAASSMSNMAFVLQGKAILRAAVEDTAVIGSSTVTTVDDLLDLARTNAVDMVIGEAITSPIEGDTTVTNVKIPLNFSVRSDYVNLWMYSIRRIAQEATRPGQATASLTLLRTDLFDKPVSLTVPDTIARAWTAGWQKLTMRLVFQNPEGATMFETPRVPILPLYIANAEGLYPKVGAVYWRIDTAFEVERVPKQYFENPLQVSLEIER